MEIIDRRLINDVTKIRMLEQKEKLAISYIDDESEEEICYIREETYSHIREIFTEECRLVKLEKF